MKYVINKDLQSYLENKLLNCWGGWVGGADEVVLLVGTYTVKKGSPVSRPQPGCHYQTLPGWE